MVNDERLDEMIKGMKLYADIPCGIKINEFSAKDLYSALLELKKWRENNLKLPESKLPDCIYCGGRILDIKQKYCCWCGQANPLFPIPKDEVVSE